MVYRKPNTLIPLELSILDALAGRGAEGGHGFAIAQELADGSQKLTSHGTLYKALGRLDGRGLVSATWEDAAIAEAAGRPRRKIYRITAAGSTAMREARTAQARPDLGGAPA